MNSILFKLFVLVAIFSIASCNNNRDTKRNTLSKKGIVLKCQGNPVSCYGKRSLALEEEPSIQQSSEIGSESDFLGEENLEGNFERILETLISNCRSGNNKSCDAILKIMLMNSK